MIRRILAWFADKSTDMAFMRGLRYEEVQSIRAARRTNKRAQGLHERVVVPIAGRE